MHTYLPDNPDNVDFLIIFIGKYEELKNCVGFVYKIIDKGWRN
jgi:hypothetical protein